LLGITLALVAAAWRRRFELRGRVVLITGGSRGLGLRLTIRALEVADRWALPPARGAGPEQSAPPGRDHGQDPSRSLATALGERAARRNREHPAGRA
jgi:NAD(P)-dependent dehydrogenase (short-subunit alcohol dehydrogenase family)